MLIWTDQIYRQSYVKEPLMRHLRRTKSAMHGIKGARASLIEPNIDQCSKGWTQVACLGQAEHPEKALLPGHILLAEKATKTALCNLGSTCQSRV